MSQLTLLTRAGSRNWKQGGGGGGGGGGAKSYTLSQNGGIYREFRSKGGGC